MSMCMYMSHMHMATDMERVINTVAGAALTRQAAVLLIRSPVHLRGWILPLTPPKACHDMDAKAARTACMQPETQALPIVC
jgi:hypothetical protein